MLFKKPVEAIKAAKAKEATKTEEERNAVQARFRD
jgi:hypothetical protein